MQALITDHYDSGHILLCLQVSCQPCRWHTICIVASLCFMSRLDVEVGLTFPTSRSVLMNATGRDSATTAQINQHTMLAATLDRRRNHTNRDAFQFQELVILILKVLWHLIVCSMNPVITHWRTEVVPEEAASGHLVRVVHGITISGDHLRCKHGSLITMMPITFFYSCK